MSYTYKYSRPALTVDCVVFGFDGRDLKVLLIERGGNPFKGQWALPGGFVQAGESTDDAARRELQEETGLVNVYLEQLYTFSEPKRDPREHVVSVAYYALVNQDKHQAKAASDAKKAVWVKLDDVGALAFDHDTILDVAKKRLEGKVRYEPIGFELVPERFKLPQLQRLYEAILDKDLDRRNFYRKLRGMELLADAGKEEDVQNRPAKYYKFDKKKYEQLKKKGFNFEL